MSDEEIKDIAELKAQVKTLFNTIGEIKDDLRELKDKFANRLPYWATAIIAVLTAACGWLAKN